MSASALGGMIDDVTNMVYRTDEEVRKGVVRHPTEAELATLLRKHDIGEDGLRVFRRVRQVFDISLGLSEASAIEDARRTITDPAALVKRIDEIKAKTAALRRAPYFPFMRYGNHTIVVRDPAGSVVNRIHVERRGFVSAERMQKKVAAELEKKYPKGYKIELGLLDDNSAPMAGMPANLLDMMEEKLELNAVQRDALEQLRYQLSPAQSFMHRFQHKNYVQGYSMDFKRSFANYGFHFSNWYIKSKYATPLREEIKGIRKEKLDTSTTPVKRDQIANWLDQHLQKDFLDPSTDFVMIKGAMVLWSLAFVPSSAFVNMSQTPMMTYPYLAAKFGGVGIGNIRATRALTEAMASLKTYYRRGTYVGMTDFEMRALDYGVKTGRIVEGMAPELAAMSSQNNLQSGFGGNLAQRGFTSFMEKGMWLFGMAEQWNRRIAYRATLKLAMRHPESKIIQEAVDANLDEYRKLSAEFGNEQEARAVIAANYITEQTQFVYERYDRPRILRGKLGTLFMFKKFMQSMFFVLLTNKKDVLPQYLVMALLLGGLQGFPGGDDAKDLIKLIAHWIFGKDYDVDKELRKLVVNLTSNPEWADLLLHGTARQGFGIPHLLNLAGKGLGLEPNIPPVDMSRALSMGNITPLQFGKLFGPAKDVDKTIAEQSQRAGGVAGNMVMNTYKAIVADNWRDFKTWERAMPRFLGNVTKAARILNEGGERNKTGAMVLKFDVRDPQHTGETMASARAAAIEMGMGFNPTPLARKWGEIRDSAEAVAYAEIKRNILLKQYFEAVVKAKDQDEKDSIIKDIRAYNATYPSMMITGETLERSIESRYRSRQAQESGTPLQKSKVPIVREIQRIYPNAVGAREVR